MVKLVGNRPAPRRAAGFLGSVAAVGALLSAAATPAGAQATFFTGAGSAIAGAADRTATFDGVVNGTPLADYAEDGLNVRVAQTATVGFDPTGGVNPAAFSGGFHYPNGGAFSPTSLTAVGGAPIYAAEFTVGNGFTQNQTTYLRVEGIGVVSGTGFTFVSALPSGTVFGFISEAALSEVRIAAYADLATASSPVGTVVQSLALDKVRVNVTPTTAAVPEAGALPLLGVGGALLPLVGAARRRSGRGRRRD
jgi:hypothetical protein